jgi:DTW domain-containing protein YfiP
MDFAVLTHPVEWKRRIATGRMAALALEGSHLLKGARFADARRLPALLEPPPSSPVLLYPGEGSRDLTTTPRAELEAEGKRLLVVVLDGTWTTAGKTLRTCPALEALPRVAFDPPAPSRLAVRSQPREHCLSTLEAIHFVLEVIGTDEDRRQAGHLLELLEWMVDLELQFRRGEREGRLPAYRPTSRPT